MRLFEQETEKEKALAMEHMGEIEVPKEVIVLEKVISPQEYIVGPGDVFEIDIILTKNINLELIVSPTGDILIPSIGKIKINGLTLEQAIELIIEKTNIVYPSAKVNVALVNLRSFKIQIAGAVVNPGFYKVTAISRLNELIELAGGFNQFAREFDIKVIRNNGQVETINIFNYRLEGDLKHNPTFLEGDQIIVPYGEPNTESIVIRGAISGGGYDIIKENETLGYYLHRQAQLLSNADLENVTITRKESDSVVVLKVLPRDFFSTYLKPGDVIDILAERGISVNGFVRAPGSFYFTPGYSCMDYINMAGGNTVEGDVQRAFVRHLDGDIETVSNATLRRGDVIIVPRSQKNLIFGELSILQIFVSFSTVLLTFIAATR
jgi:protein involved in polysaccharide export with SLBB domain